MSEQEKKRQKIYVTLNAKVSLSNVSEAKKKFFFFTEQELFKKKVKWRIKQKT